MVLDSDRRSAGGYRGDRRDSLGQQWKPTGYVAPHNLLDTGCATLHGATIGGAPHSKLVHMTLPRGSTPTGGQSVPGLETWHVPLGVPETVANLRPQLPIDASYDRLPWCAESIDLRASTTRWSWGTAQDLLRIAVGPFYPTLGVRGPGS
jgi:hypothetical protein